MCIGLFQAMRSLQKYPLRLSSGKDAKILEHFGKLPQIKPHVHVYQNQYSKSD